MLECRQLLLDDHPGTHRTLVVFDPVAGSARRAVFRGMDPITTLRPRYAGYREVVKALEATRG